MKRNLILSVILFLLIAGCSKDSLKPEEEELNNEKHLLSFTIDGFSQDLVPFANQIKALNLSASASHQISAGNTSNSIQATASSDIRDHINTIEIKIFRKGALIDSVRQFAADPDFGTYKKYHSITTSQYMVSIVGAMLEHNGDFATRPLTNQSNPILDHHIKMLPYPANAFYFQKQIDLNGGDVHETAKLKRFVGRLDIELMEEIPSTAHRIEITTQNTAQYFIPFEQRGYYYTEVESEDHTPYHTVKNIILKPEHFGKPSFSFNAYHVLKGKLGGAPQTTTVILKAYDSADKVIQTKEIPDVMIQTNMRTKLSGYLFSAPNLNFDMEIAADWDSEIPAYEF